jgi:hypothetical protein
MKTACLTIIIGLVILGGWAYASEQELANHLQDVQNMQVMDDASCPPSSGSGGQ